MPSDGVSGVHLLGEHVPAEGDAALQGDRCEIGALSAFRFHPGPHRGNQPRKRRAQRSEEHTSELQSQSNLVCRLLLEKKKTRIRTRLSIAARPPFAAGHATFPATR